MSSLINISEGVSLALHGLAFIAQQSPEKITVKQLSRELDASEAHLAKVFQKLSKADFVKSSRGPKGGFVLNKPPKEISFLDIFETIEGKVTIGRCPLGRPRCMFSSCIFSNSISKATSILYNNFKSINLSNFTK